jgi:hypothetical protein
MSDNISNPDQPSARSSLPNRNINTVAPVARTTNVTTKKVGCPPKCNQPVIKEILPDLPAYSTRSTMSVKAVPVNEKNNGKKIVHKCGATYKPIQSRAKK